MKQLKTTLTVMTLLFVCIAYNQHSEVTRTYDSHNVLQEKTIISPDSKSAIKYDSQGRKIGSYRRTSSSTVTEYNKYGQKIRTIRK